MSRVVHPEIPAENPEWVAGFYKKVLGWEIQKWEGPVDYWLSYPVKKLNRVFIAELREKRTGLHQEFS